MKIERFNENLDNSNVEELFKQLDHYDKKTREIDSKLAEICRGKIKHLLDDGKGEEAKKIYRNFYKPTFDSEDSKGIFSFEKDFVLMEINKVIKINQDQKKFNL